MNALKTLSGFIFLVITFFCFDMDAALAHHPHDVIEAISISPNYEQDSTLFIIYDKDDLLKSEDGGQSWERIGKFLDNKYRLSALEVSSQSNKTLFLSSLGDGIYKSQDGGSSWFKVNQGLETLNIDLVSVSPHDSEFVLAAGTNNGLYKTENGGKSWEQVIGDNRKITAIAYFAKQKERIVIGDRQGNLYLSEDGGNVWQPLSARQNSGAINAISLSPNFASDNTLFVGTQKEGILKSVNGGRSFSEVNEGLSDKSILSLAISPNYDTDFTLLASTWNKGVFQSNDGAKSWQKYNKGLTKTAQADTYKQPHFSDLKISPKFSEDKVIFVGGFDGLFKSTNGGHTWKNVETANGIAGEIKGIALSPDYGKDSTVAINTFYQGNYLSNDRGITWTDINKELAQDHHLKHNRIGRVEDIAFSPNYRSDKTIFSGLYQLFFKSTDGGKSWQKTPLPVSQEGWLDKQQGIKTSDMRIVVSPSFASDKTIYLRMLKGGGGILRSTNGGKNFSLVGNLGPKEHTSSLVMSPDFASDKTLYLGVADGVYKSVDRGSTWKLASKGIDMTEGDYVQLAISPDYQVDGTVLAGTRKGLFVTNNRGKDWRKLAGEAYGRDSHVQAIAISPNYQSDRTFLISVRGKGLFKTIDKGENFTKIGDNYKNIKFINFSPSYASDQTIWIASKPEVFKSTNGGNSWEIIALPKDNNFLYYLYLRLTISPKRIFAVAFIAGLLSYLSIGYLRLEKKLLLNKFQLKISGAFVAFVGVSILLSI